MTRPSSSDQIYLSPGAAGSGAMRLPGAHERLNPDDHLVQPGTRQEVVRGRRVEVSPARPGHGDTHCRLGRLVDFDTAPGYVASMDLLTRRSQDSDFATDVCVRKAGRNPETGHRYLEELSFEIFFTQSLAESRERARDVVGHGVRRMFGVFVKEAYPDADVDSAIEIAVKEWSPERDDWVTLDRSSCIEDPCLRTPLPVAALVDAAAANDAAAGALIAQRNPVIEEFGARKFRDGEVKGFRDGEAEGRLQARREMLLQLLTHRDLAVTAEQHARILACVDAAELERWLARAFGARSTGELFD